MNADDILELSITSEDLKKGADYAAITLPWTFNRMMTNNGSRGQQMRALNIAKGVASQAGLIRALKANGASPVEEVKSHRDGDLFDLQVEIRGRLMDIDFKTFHHYSDYDTYGRPPLSKSTIAKYASYGGPDWRTFFPMLVPHTQINAVKDGYIFGIASSRDPRNTTADENARICAFPFAVNNDATLANFLYNTSLCRKREEAGKGFYLRAVNANPTLFAEPMTVQVNGEWDGRLVQRVGHLEAGETTVLGPFSMVSSFEIPSDQYQMWTAGSLNFSVETNELLGQVRAASGRDLNRISPEAVLPISKSDFCNLTLPADYTVLVLGWISRTDYLKKCRNHEAWVWPADSINKFENQRWSQITDSDVKSFTRAGFDDKLKVNRTRSFQAGWLKTTGRGGGACCYYYPNIGYNGGIKETNLYVLPADLNPMNTLV